MCDSPDVFVQELAREEMRKRLVLKLRSFQSASKQAKAIDDKLLKAQQSTLAAQQEKLQQSGLKCGHKSFSTASMEPSGYIKLFM